jgi:hypothetical protein
LLIGANWIALAQGGPAQAEDEQPSIAATDPPKPEAKEAKIQDNLFLLEEAYNQEPGVVQHIQTMTVNENFWTYSLTDEWPVPRELHQLSFTLQMLHSKGGKAVELGDLLLNYRLQAFDQGLLAIAPRLSLVLPTGKYATGAGRGSPGIQFSVPVSLDLHRYFVTHLNAGGTFTPQARSPLGDKANTFDLSAGVALVFLPFTWANALVELVYQSVQAVDAGGGTSRGGTFTINPGVRFALDFTFGLQIVPGLSLPIATADGQTTTSVLLYLSFEHPVWNPS